MVLARSWKLILNLDYFISLENQTTLQNSRGVDPSYTSSNKGKLGTSHKATYEVISKSIIENGKVIKAQLVFYLLSYLNLFIKD